jgi:hypothetical protein
MASGDVDAHRRGVAIAADEYARSVTEAAGIHRGAVARLIAELMDAETMAAAARIKVELTTVQNQYETALMTETIARHARSDQLAAPLRVPEKRQVAVSFRRRWIGLGHVHRFAGDAAVGGADLDD